VRGTECEPLLQAANPDGVTIWVVEQGDTIVGAWSLVLFAHVEGLWVAPAYRRRGRRILRKLWNMLVAIAGARGLSAVLTGGLTPDVVRLITWRGGVAMPPAYVVPIRPWRED